MAEPESIPNQPTERAAPADPPVAAAPATPAEPAVEAATIPADPAKPAAERPAAPARPAAAPPPTPIGERQPPRPEAAALAADIERAWSGIAYESKFNFGDLDIYLPADHLVEACTRCKNDSALAFDYFMSLAGVDYEKYLELVYHLYSYRYHRRLTIHVKLDDLEHPSVPSVTFLWPGADWHERETAEMFGIDFPGHPNLAPLLLEEGVDERPLRKSHPLVPIYADRPGVIRKPDESPV